MPLHGVDLVNALISKKDLQYFIHMVWGEREAELRLYEVLFYLYLCLGY